jgi:hypothetical protein
MVYLHSYGIHHLLEWNLLKSYKDSKSGCVKTNVFFKESFDVT